MKLETPYIVGWEVTTNENNIKMATIPLDKMHEVVKYLVDSKEQLIANNKSIIDLKAQLSAYELRSRANYGFYD